MTSKGQCDCKFRCSISSAATFTVHEQYAVYLAATPTNCLMCHLVIQHFSMETAWLPEQTTGCTHWVVCLNIPACFAVSDDSTAHSSPSGFHLIKFNESHLMIMRCFSCHNHNPFSKHYIGSLRAGNNADAAIYLL